MPTLHSRYKALSVAPYLVLVSILFLTTLMMFPRQLALGDSINDEVPGLSLIQTCTEQIDAIEAELEEEARLAAEAAKPDSVKRAEASLGVPYRSGGSSPYGFDCSGLVSYALTGNYGHAYTSYSFWGMSAVSDPRPGDVVACSPGHCGLYIGDGLMIHAPQSGEYVRVEAIRGKIVRP